MTGNHCNYYSFGVLLMAVVFIRKEVLVAYMFSFLKCSEISGRFLTCYFVCIASCSLNLL